MHEKLHFFYKKLAKKNFTGFIKTTELKQS